MDLDALEAARTLAAAKAALERWHGHMRRGAQLRNETEYAAALALVPALPTPKPFMLKTLRGLADLYASERRLEEAGALYDRLSREATRHSLSFLREHLALLFRLAEQRLSQGEVALASSAMEEVAKALGRAEDPRELAKQASDGYALIAEAFERARQPLPAQLYASRSLEQAALAGEPARPAALFRRLAQIAFQRRDPPRALAWLEQLIPVPGQGAAQASAAAQALGQSAASAGRLQDATAYFKDAEAWLGGEAAGGPALADLYLAWSFWLPKEEAVVKSRSALDLRERFLGPGHPRTQEAARALRSLEQGGFEAGAAAAKAAPDEDAAPRAWDGGASFAVGPQAPSAAEAKRLQRRLVVLAHPDRASSTEDARRRHEWMLRVNEAASRGDIFALRTLLREILAAGTGAASQS